MLKITADIFSGRPNPEWIIEEAQAGPLLKDLSLSGAPAAMESGFQGLGNRGLIVETLSDHHQKDFNLPDRFRLAGGGGAHEGLAAELAEKLLATMTQERASHPMIVETQSKEAGAAPLDANLRKFILEGLPGRQGSVLTVEPRAAEELKLEEHAASFLCGFEAGLFNPGFWNDPAHIGKNNCYNYASNHRTNTFAQPGRASGHMYHAIDCADVTNGAVSDGASLTCAPPNQAPRWFMALVIAPGWDYHWYRKSREGFWGHKPGGTAARNTDNSGVIIHDPRFANRGPYTIFCRFMFAQRKMVVR